MPKFLKPGKVVVILAGRYAGRKAVIVRTFDDGQTKRRYGHCIVAGIEKYPLSVTKKMGKARAAKRSRVKPFIKVINYNHVLPTRYSLEMQDLRKLVPAEALATNEDANSLRVKARKDVKLFFEKRYAAGKNPWFFTKLRF